MPVSATTARFSPSTARATAKAQKTPWPPFLFSLLCSALLLQPRSIAANAVPAAARGHRTPVAVVADPDKEQTKSIGEHRRTASVPDGPSWYLAVAQQVADLCSTLSLPCLGPADSYRHSSDNNAEHGIQYHGNERCIRCCSRTNVPVEDHSMTTRASVSRRSSLGMGPSAMRSRSQERSVRKYSDNLDSASQIVDEFNDSGRFDDDLATEENNVDSERCSQRTRLGSTDRRGHRRAMSDPFDTAESGGITDKDLEAVLEGETAKDEDGNALPTLPRFPVSETRDSNCWSEPPVSIFRVRGPNYLQDHKKIPSDEYLLRARGCDLFLSDDPQKCVIGDNVKGVLNGSLRRAPSLLVRFTFPWGLLIQYFEIPSKLADFMDPEKGVEMSMSGFNPAEKTLAKWLAGDADYKNQRFKLIPYVAEGPWVVRHMVTGKPAIIGTKLPVKYSCTPSEGNKAGFLVVDLDIGNSSTTAKSIVSVCRRYMSSLTVDIGFVIQANEQDELPECMLGSIRIHRADPIKAPTIG